MLVNEIFNSTVCIIGIAIFLIHATNVLIKKNKREDEVRLFVFLVFTAIHFLTYLIFTLLKHSFEVNSFVIGFYTTFYIFNNIEVFLLFMYMLSYVKLSKKMDKVLSIVNYSVFALFVILDIVNIFTGIFFTSKAGVYERSKLMILSQGYQFIMFIIVFIVALTSKKLGKSEKIAFGIYCVLPLVAIILQNYYKGYAIAYLSIIISIEILFFFVNVQKNILIIQEQQKSKEAQVRVMMSQIQPHFIYNSLSSISTLISIDPKRAQKSLDDFTEYLRHNLASLTETNLIPFEEELKHIETFISLEKVRFNERLKVVYDINTVNFNVPPLSVEPIVENAIKHGVLKKIEGGTVTFRTYEREDAFVVEVIDDGVGFDINSVKFDSNKHFGINNIKYRLKTMCNGELTITSEIGVGTKSTITFMK